MAVANDLMQALSDCRRIKIVMPESDGLLEGRDLVTKLQAECNFPLVYIQRLGHDPAVLVWRMRDECHAMEGYQVSRYAC